MSLRKRLVYRWQCFLHPARTIVLDHGSAHAETVYVIRPLTMRRVLLVSAVMIPADVLFVVLGWVMDYNGWGALVWASGIVTGYCVAVLRIHPPYMRLRRKR